MAVTDSRRPLDELAKVGSEVYDRQIRPTLRPEDDGKFVAVDVDTGQFEVDKDDYTAIMRLRARRPEAEVWLERAGQPTAYVMRRSQ